MVGHIMNANPFIASAQDRQCLLQRRVNLHSKKFKMNEEVDSFLSEKVSNLLLTWKVNAHP